MGESRTSSTSVTRVFVLEASGAGSFLELSWIGREVETTTGKIGTTGRSREQAFESEQARDTYLATKIAAALAKGYVEVDQLPGAPDPIDLLAAAVRREAWLAATTPTAAPRGTRIGGQAWMARGDDWPACAACALPTTLLLQISGADLPEAWVWLAGPTEIFQLFVCMNDCAHRSAEPCAILRRVSSFAAGALRSPGGEHVCLQPRSVQFTRRDDYPHALEGAAPADVLQQRGLACLRGHKLGGWPCWVGERTQLLCRARSRSGAECACAMEPILQIDRDDVAKLVFGDDGTGWLFRCSTCRATAFHWQSA